jgi:hypothetical protein
MDGASAVARRDRMAYLPDRDRSYFIAKLNRHPSRKDQRRSSTWASAVPDDAGQLSAHPTIMRVLSLPIADQEYVDAAAGLWI